jgi:hypothetical protein
MSIYFDSLFITVIDLFFVTYAVGAQLAYGEYHWLNYSMKGLQPAHKQLVSLSNKTGIKC